MIQGPNPEGGIVFQQDVLLEWRTALQNIMMQAEIRSSARAGQGPRP